MRIEVFDHPFEPVPPVVFEATHIGAWLLSYYGDTPDIRVQVFEGEPSLETEITGNIERLMASDAPRYTVLESPAGLDPLTWGIFAAAAVLAVAAVVLMPKPSMPSNINRTQASPNNSLSDRNNQLRMLERVEDIYGQVRAIPSLMMPTYTKYHDNRQYEYGYYCISRGYLDVTDVRDADTLVSDIDGSSAAIYAPFTSPNSGDLPQLLIGHAIADPILSVRRAEEVDGITLKAPNQVQIPAGEGYDFVSDPDGDLIIQRNPNPNFDDIAQDGQQLTISMVPPSHGSITDAATVSGGNTVFMNGIDTIALPGRVLTFAGFANAGNNTARQVISVNTGVVTLGGAAMTPEAAASVTATATGQDLSGTYTILLVEDATIRLTTHTWYGNYTDHPATIALVGASEWSNWVTLPDDDRTQIWCNIIAPQGMYKNSGSGYAPTGVNFELQSERLDPDLNPTGLVETFIGALSGSSPNERALTFERFTTYTGPVRVRMRRSTNFDFGFSGTLVDEIKWQDLYAVTPAGKTHFGNKTTLQTVTKATQRATSLRNRQINCLAYRKLPIYDGSGFSGAFDADGRLISGTIAATSQIADILAAVSLDPKIGQRQIDELDMPQIYAANQAANAIHPEAGQFNYTFDSDSISYEETATTIANAAFCVAYRQNGKIRLSLDQAQPISTALFTHRNKQPRSDTITRNFASDSQYDGVEFQYQDPDTENNETIILPLDHSAQRLKKFEIPGIRSFAQAWLRANREYYKLAGQRLTLKTNVTGEGRALLPNARIDVVDNTRYSTYDGEIVGQNGLEVVLSRDVTFTPNAPHSLMVIRRDGSLESIPVTPGSAANHVLLAYAPSEALVTNYGPDGVRTIFSFAEDVARDSMAWLVQEIDQSDSKYVGINAINYSADYFQADNLPIPNKNSIINN